MAPRKDIIHQSEHLTVVHSESDSPTVIVTFNEIVMAADGLVYWGDRLLERMGVSAIGFVSARANWYPPADMQAAIAAALPRIAGRRVVTYGFSQGGYGALKFAAPLGATLALGFSPQWSIDPADVAAFDGRFHHHHHADLRNGERIVQADLCPSNFIVLDWNDSGDRENANRLLELDGVCAIPAPFCGHGTIGPIAEGGMGQALIRLCTAERTIAPGEVRALLRQGRRGSAIYKAEKIRQLLPRRARHPRFFKAAVGELPDGPSKTLNTLIIELEGGKPDRAKALLDGMSEEALLMADFAPHWHSFRDREFLAGEARIAGLFKKKYPDSVYARLYGVDSMIRIGATEAALEELDALKTMPDFAHNSEKAIALLRGLGRNDIAATLLERLAETDPRRRRECIEFGLRHAEACLRDGDRAACFRELRRIERLCADDEASLIQIAEFYLHIDERSLAREIFQLLAKTDPAIYYDIMIARCVFVEEKALAEAMIEAALAKEIDDPHTLLRLTQVTEIVLGARRAIAPARRAVSLLDMSASLEARKKLIDLYMAADMIAAARDDIAAFCAIKDPSVVHYLPHFATIAQKVGQTELIVTLLMRQRERAPSDINTNLALLTALIDSGQTGAAGDILEGFLVAIEAGLPMHRDHFTLLITLALKTDYALSVRVAQCAVGQYPDEADFQARARYDSFSAMLYAKREPARTDVAKSAPAGSRGLLGWIGLRARR